MKLIMNESSINVLENIQMEITQIESHGGKKFNAKNK